MKIESIADQAKRHIEVWITKGEYEPGRQLKEEEIAARLGISRPPVREAFKLMEAEGLVVRKPRRGVFVTEMTAKDVWEAYTLKAAMYEMAAELALERITGPQINKLETLVDQMERCVSVQPVDLLQYQQYHQDFHDQIIEISGHERLKKISNSIHNQVCRFSYKSLQNSQHLHASVRYHRKALNALKMGDKKLACRLTKGYVLKTLTILLSIPELQTDFTSTANL
jgi:DNA-binding GntR family transcriptional regulator